jgi:perosamine synthetase
MTEVQNEKHIPYGRQCIEPDDIEAVIEVLRSDWLTTGPKVREFESHFSKRVNSLYSIAVSSGTAGLHAAMYASGIGPGDEVIVPAMTFAATANAVVFQGGVPVFADVNQDTLLIDVRDVEAKITPKSRAVVAVDYAGQPCDYDELRKLAASSGITIIADACHSLGAQYKARPVGSLGDLSVFSFHPVKHITCGEGGLVTTNDAEMANKIAMFRNHGINLNSEEREQKGTWFYEMTDLGYNYRLTDIQCALAASQLRKLDRWVEYRRKIALMYDAALTELPKIEPLKTNSEIYHSYHLYVVRCENIDRDYAFHRLRDRGIGVNVHYIPVHLHPFYRNRFGTGLGLCPRAEKAYEQILSLPIHPGITEHDFNYIIDVLHEIF